MATGLDVASSANLTIATQTGLARIYPLGAAVPRSPAWGYATDGLKLCPNSPSSLSQQPRP